MQPARFTLSWALLLAILLSLASAIPIESDANIENSGDGNLIIEDAMSSAINSFQSFAQMNMTGVLDEQTEGVMSLPRCGVIDKVETSTHARRRRHAFEEDWENWAYIWKVKALTYRIHSYPSNVTTHMTRAEVDSEIARAFEVWSNCTDLTFTAISSGEADINMAFVQGEHGDGDPFMEDDGLAHSLKHLLGGYVHFNDAQNWTLGSDTGNNLFQIAAHKIGHSLGLDHSNFNGSVMYKSFLGYKPSFSLHADDVEAIQCLYGKRTIENKPNEPSTVPESPVADCGRDGLVDETSNSRHQFAVSYVLKELQALNRTYNRLLEKLKPQHISKCSSSCA